MNRQSGLKYQTLSTNGRLWRCLVALLLPACAKAACAWSLKQDGLLPCIFKSLTELPCLFCGGTHAVLHLLSLDISQALQDNTAVTLICIAMLPFGALIFLESVTGRRLLPCAAIQKIQSWTVRLGGLVLLSNWAAMLAHAA